MLLSVFRIQGVSENRSASEMQYILNTLKPTETVKHDTDKMTTELSQTFRRPQTFNFAAINLQKGLVHTVNIRRISVLIPTHIMFGSSNLHGKWMKNLKV